MPQNSEDGQESERILRGNQLSHGYFINSISVIICKDINLKCLPFLLDVIAFSFPITLNQEREDLAQNKGVIGQQ